VEAVAQSPLEQARAAFEDRDWERAQALFEQVDAEGGLGVEDLQALGSTHMMTSSAGRAREFFVRALALSEKSNHLVGIAKCSVMLARFEAEQGNMSKAMGLLARAERTLEDVPPNAAHGHLWSMQAFLLQMRGKLDQAMELAERAFALGREHGDLELQAVSLVRQGRVLIRQGEVEKGLSRLDEAMTGVYGDRIDPIASSVVYCTTIDACTDLADYARAVEWSDMATAWCERRHTGGFPGICRVHRAELLRMRGDFDGARREAENACSLLGRFEMRFGVGMGLTEVGMVRLYEGDLDGADRAFDEADECGANPEPGRSLLWLARGQIDSAMGSIRNAIETKAEDDLARAKLLPAGVEIGIAAEDFDQAHAWSQDLAAIAKRYETTGLEAAAATGCARVCLAREDLSGCVNAARKAVQAWTQIDAPLEAAKARLVLAEAYASQGNAEQAAKERRAADKGLARIATQVGVSLVTPGSGTPPDGVASPQGDATPDEKTVGAETVTAAHGPIEGLIDGKIEILRTIGRGGMGTVLEGRHRLTGRKVAVKVLHLDSADRARHAHRLLQEALATGRIQHPNVVDVYDAGEHGMAPYLVMERLEGESLAERLRRDGKLPVSEAVDIVCQAAAGVHAAHEVGVVHRDIKPDNLFLACGQGEGIVVKVLDFGISKLSDVDGAHTRTGAILGTPYYMAPEQVTASSEVDARADVYALGVVLFELLTGEVPFRADNYAALITKIVTEPFPSARELRPDVPEAIDQVLRGATLRELEGRPASAAALAERLRGALVD
jgi:tetratricopeptide (TPR) repeat protein